MNNVYASFSHPIRVPPKSKLIMGPEEFKDYHEQIKNLKFIRGHFLEIILEIEAKINLYIEKSLISKNSNLKNVFRKKILHSRTLSLSSKIDLLYDIIKTRKEMRESDLKELFNSLKTLIEERNKWAHGYIFFQQKKIKGKLKMQAYLEHIKKGEFVKIKLTNSYFDNLNKKLETIHEKLTQSMKN